MRKRARNTVPERSETRKREGFLLVRRKKCKFAAKFKDRTSEI